MSVQNRTPLPQGWKVWVLLTSVGLTAMGSWAIRSANPAEGSVAPASGGMAPRSELVAELTAARPSERASRALPRRGSKVDGLPMMPAKPMFAAPVTRTRRS